MTSIEQCKKAQVCYPYSHAQYVRTQKVQPNVCYLVTLRSFKLSVSEKNQKLHILVCLFVFIIVIYLCIHLFIFTKLLRRSNKTMANMYQTVKVNM